MPTEELLIDKAQLLTLTAPEMTVLVGGMRVLDTNAGRSKHGVFTKRPDALTNDFFVNLLDMGTEWKPTSDGEGRVRGARSQDGSGEVDRHPGRSRLRFALGAPRAGGGVRELGCQEKFVRDFVAAWDKVMNLDRFDVR